MGEEIEKSRFKKADFERFQKRLRHETALLMRWFQEGKLQSRRKTVGFELETWLVDKNCTPVPLNEPFVEQLHTPLVTPELSSFNVEIDSSPYAIGKETLRQLHEELEQTWLDCQTCAQTLDSQVLMIGIPPTLREEMLTLDYMSPLHRYRALNEQVLRLRQGHPFKLDIEGADHLVTSHRDVMLEAAATSLQIHLEVELEQSVRFYNASLILSAPMVALAANSPFLFGKDLWDETRIPLFEQAVSPGHLGDRDKLPIERVTFGKSYVRESLLECFIENLDAYPVLLPTEFKEEVEQLPHLRLHNGTIWRWNRPLVGITPQGAHLRIEHRVIPAGPSIVDLIANIAFYLGLVYALATERRPPETQIPFSQARANFYAAAKNGLRAEILWRDGKVVPVRQLLLKKLIPMAKKGLRSLGIDKKEIDHYLGQIIEKRVRSGQNGATWQRRLVEKRKCTLQELTTTYAERQKSGLPVHEWSL